MLIITIRYLAFGIFNHLYINILFHKYFGLCSQYFMTFNFLSDSPADTFLYNIFYVLLSFLFNLNLSFVRIGMINFELNLCTTTKSWIEDYLTKLFVISYH